MNQLFHGSNVVVKNPKILVNGFYKDFGYGFYCTVIEKQARRWALTKRKNHIVSIFQYEKNKSLSILSFSEMTEEWLQFVVDCRRGIEHRYDVVEGPMADDTIWNYIEDYISGEITKNAFWELVKFRYPTHQIVFCTEKALETLRYERSYRL
jgi:hypothetical protein